MGILFVYGLLLCRYYGLYLYMANPTRLKAIIVLLLLLFSNSRDVLAQQWLWARSPTCSAPSQGGSEGWLVKNDAAGNVFMAGYYYGSQICFGSNTFYNPVNSANNTQSLLVKYDNAGNLLWSAASSNGQSKPISIATDAAGNLLLYGVYTTSSIQFGSTVLNNPGFDFVNPLLNKAFYLIKYDASGAVLWAQTSGSNISPDPTNLHSGGIATDADNCVYITGTFSTPVLAVGTKSVGNAGGSNGTTDMFLAKYAADGSITWLKSFGGLKDDYAADLAIGPGGNLYLAGNYSSGFINFGSTTLYSQFKKAFVAALDSSGSALWAKAGETKGKAEAVAVTAANDIYIAGGFTDTVNFGDYFSCNFNGGYYLMKFDAAGNVNSGTILSFTQPVSTCCYAYGLTADKCNNIWLSANLDKNAGLKLDNSTTLSAPAGSSDPMFFAGFNESGQLVANVALKSGAGNNTGLSNTGLSADSKGNIYLSGDYRVLNPFVLGPDSLRIYNNAIATIFVAKYSTALACDTVVTPPSKYPDIPIITINPNPASQDCVLDYNGSLGTGAASVAIRDIAGKLIATYPLTGHQTILPVGYLPQGIYVCMVKVEARPIYTILLSVLR